MHLTEPMCIIGASMGGAVVCMFAIKYPEYVGMLCLLAPIANEECETDLIRQLRGGVYNALLPETPEQLRQMINTLTVKRINLPGPFLNGFLHLRLRLLEEHKKVLASLIQNDYPNIESNYEQLRQLYRPALILWGRQDRVYAFNGAEFFCKLLPNAESVIFDECGHFMAIDKPEETAESILTFFDKHANYQIYLRTMGTGASANKKPRSPYHRMLAAQVRKAKATRFVAGEASDFYFHCANGDTDQVRKILEAPDRQSIDKLVKLERNGNTALHVAAEKGHADIVKLLLEHGCSRTILNHLGKRAFDGANMPEMRRLFIRSESSDRFHENDAASTMAAYLPESNAFNTRTISVPESDATTTTNTPTLNFFESFKTEEAVYEHSLNYQTTAMWLQLFNWFSRTFPSFFQGENLHLETFQLHKNTDFNDFLKKKLGDRYQETIEEFNKAQEKNSIEALLTIYSSERTGFYRSLNRQLADSPAEADNSPHLCDRFIIEFHIRGDELAKRAFIGTTFRGATVSSQEVSDYETLCENKPRGVIVFKAFTSTSENKEIALEFVGDSQPTSDKIGVLFIFDIDVSSPTIVGIANVSDYPHEQEILIMPGNLFTVTKVSKDVVTYTAQQKRLVLTEVYLKYLHMPVSFWDKILHTYRSAHNSVTNIDNT